MQLITRPFRDATPNECNQRPAFEVVADAVYRSNHQLIMTRLITTLLEKGVLTPEEARYVSCSGDYEWSI